jgi:S-adenosylmethionine:tRNA ribosyltransferase-isomerase
MSDLQKLLAQYDYSVPPELVATTPAHPRDSARLLVYHRTHNTIEHVSFRDIGRYLPAGSVLVCNDTRVIPARLHATHENGRVVEIFITQIGADGHIAHALANRHLDVGDTVRFASGAAARITLKEGKECTIIIDESQTWRALLEASGTTPIPPYLKHTTLSEEELRVEYQTVFAKYDGSVAAPTASLHFTEQLLGELAASGIQIAYVTLHVNLGTFAPLSEEALSSGKLHKETFYIPEASQKMLSAARSEGRPIIPVGTTALRTIESAFTEEGVCHTSSGTTQLFIQEGYTFKMTSGLITNFHVPQSSLMMLVAALVGREKLLELYEKAVAARYRLFSFGDAMLIL